MLTVVVGDPSFENVRIPTGSYSPDQTATAWTFTGAAGITGYNSQLSGAYGEEAPDGIQSAYLQGSSASFSQQIDHWDAGTYQISFSASQAGYVNQDFEVLLDGSPLASFRPGFAKIAYERMNTPHVHRGGGQPHDHFSGLEQRRWR